MKEYLEKEIKKIRKKNGRGLILSVVFVLVSVFSRLAYDAGHFSKGLRLMLEKNHGWIMLGVVVILVMLWYPFFKRLNRYVELINQLDKLEEEEGG